MTDSTEANEPQPAPEPAVPGSSAPEPEGSATPETHESEPAPEPESPGTTEAQDTPSPGWYPDPNAGGANLMRYWDGDAWTDRVQGGSEVSTTRRTADERKVILSQQLQTAAARGLRIESQSDFQAVLVEGKPVNHTLHAILTIFTCLLWGGRLGDHRRDRRREAANGGGGRVWQCHLATARQGLALLPRESCWRARRRCRPRPRSPLSTGRWWSCVAPCLASARFTGRSATTAPAAEWAGPSCFCGAAAYGRRSGQIPRLPSSSPPSSAWRSGRCVRPSGESLFPCPSQPSNPQE